LVGYNPLYEPDYTVHRELKPQNKENIDFFLGRVTLPWDPDQSLRLTLRRNHRLRRRRIRFRVEPPPNTCAALCDLRGPTSE